MRIIQLDKQAFLFSNNPKDLLGGISSNTLDAAKNALLTAQGKIIAVCDQKQLDDDRLLWVVDDFAADGCRNMFEKFAVFTQTKYEQRPDAIYYDLDGDAPADGTCIVLPQEQGYIIVGGQFETNVSAEEFIQFRLDHHLPLHGIDFTDEMLLNVFPENYVSYTKGCFVGQEVIARVHNLSQPPRKLVVRYADQCSETEQQQMTSKTPDPSNRTRGFVFVNNK